MIVSPFPYNLLQVPSTFGNSSSIIPQSCAPWYLTEPVLPRQTTFTTSTSDTMRRASAVEEGKGHSRTYSISTVSGSLSQLELSSPSTTALQSVRLPEQPAEGRSGIRRLKGTFWTQAPQTASQTTVVMPKTHSGMVVPGHTIRGFRAN